MPPCLVGCVFWQGEKDQSPQAVRRRSPCQRQSMSAARVVTPIASPCPHPHAIPQAGKTEILIMSLPGYPDGVSRAPDGNFWVPIVTKHVPVLDWAVRSKLARWALAWLSEVVDVPISHVGMVVKVGVRSCTGGVLVGPKGAYKGEGLGGVCGAREGKNERSQHARWGLGIGRHCRGWSGPACPAGTWGGHATWGLHNLATPHRTEAMSCSQPRDRSHRPHDLALDSFPAMARCSSS